MDFDIFQDHLHIAWGQKWEKRLDDTLDSVKLLIPIITPTFFKSEACRAEVARFALREQQLGRDDLIFPVYYFNAKELEDKGKREQDAIAAVIARHQRMDWRKLRHDPLTSPDVGRMLEKMAEQIVAAMERGSGHSLLVPSVEIIRPLPVGSPVAPASPASPAPAIEKPAWASAVGVDVIGKWAEMSVNNVVQRLRWIEPGNFLMGSPKNEAGRYDDEWPQHQVTINRGLWLADTACTQELWQAVMGKNPSLFHKNNGGGPQHPVECVSWDMIQVFLQAMRAKWPGCQATLPTNKWGLYQMHGNVWEWCADERRDYEDKAVGDPGLADALKVPGEGEAARVLRGGGWFYDALYARSAFRFHYLPDWRNGYAGFRLAFRS